MKRAGIAGILAFTACFGGALETAQANEPATISGGQNAPSVVASRDPLPSYFKTGILDFVSRVWAQKQIERVYFSHRIWPKENSGAKPNFEAMVPEALIRIKVTDSLKKSAALDAFWRQVVTVDMLQAEMDRMTRQTRDPAMLKELFAALHDDPRLIAESLVRSSLTDRLIQSRYARDVPLHAQARARAEAAAARAEATNWRESGAGIHRVTLLNEKNERSMRAVPTPDERIIDTAEFEMLRKKYERNHDGRRPPPMSLALRLANGEMSPAQRAATVQDQASLVIPATYRGEIKETAEQFAVIHVVQVSEARIEIETIRVPKVPFSKWWEMLGPKISTVPAAEPAVKPAAGWTLRPISANAPGCDHWDAATNFNALPDARGGHGAVWTGTEMIIWGGYDGAGWPNTGGRYNPATDSWAATSTGLNTPEGREWHSTIWTGTEMIIWGGGAYLNSGGRYNPVTDTWLPVSVGLNTPEARFRHSAIWTGTEMIIWGGASYTTQQNNFNNGGRYNPSIDTWLAISTGLNVPSARSEHTAVWTGTEMIVWGGGATLLLNTGGRYNPQTDSWRSTSTGANAPVARSAHTAVWTGSTMIIFGGGIIASPGRLNSGGRYDPLSDTWLPMSTGVNVPSARANHTAIWTGSTMVVWGGSAIDGYTNTGGRYDPVTDIWQQTGSSGNIPSGRFNHTAIWTGSEMIVWGGDIGPSQETYVNDGWRYNVAADAWLPTNSGTGIPAGRLWHSAVWTGAEMIIWGGSSDTYTLLDSGGRYDPAVDAWQPTGMGQNLPAARGFHTAIWSGTEMIVWGGDDGYNYFNSGGRYDVVGDSWLPTDEGTNVPEGRRYHTAVWTGTEMIIWGGRLSSTFPNFFGGRYNPRSDTWLPTSTGENIPIGRYFHSAVWTGTEMIIWGGYGPGYLNDGGRYRPDDDTWQPTSTGAHVPAARWQHAAVWTGTEMIVWGGNFNTGGRYNPADDTWLPTSTGANVPVARGRGSAVWTGVEFIVWGGAVPNTTSVFGTGGRYRPASDEWLSISASANVPSARTRQASVWTGSQLIFWGGDNGGNGLNSGGIYDPGSVAGPGNSLRGAKSPVISLNWSYVPGAGSYNVKRCSPAGSQCIPGQVVSTPTINQYSEMDDGVSHFYAVEAVNQCGTTD